MMPFSPSINVSGGPLRCFSPFIPGSSLNLSHLYTRSLNLSWTGMGNYFGYPNRTGERLFCFYSRPCNRFNCERIVHGDKDYLYNLQNKIITYKDTPNLSLKCEDIYERNHFLNITRSEDEKKFPLAFARIVNQDYRFLEAELATNYHPQNWYCFAVDSKANDSFYEKILALASCFKNIIIPRSRYPVDSGGEKIFSKNFQKNFKKFLKINFFQGHGMGKAHLSCFKELIKKERKWEYLVTLQNHDIQIKTNEEMVQIFKWIGGACDAEYNFHSKVERDRLDGLNKKFNWTFESLKIFKDGKKSD
ncbi:unnamed protein product [Meloidogyne enterolobii]|uniref:Uncharacterized protein n=1 Tax=Meloidogyne enterolobii TaxID=390850 RepID=A0ACB0XRS8_MELEN